MVGCSDHALLMAGFTSCAWQQTHEARKMPTRDETRGDVDYFVLFIIMASFLLLNVFVAIILDNFNQRG